MRSLRTLCALTALMLALSGAPAAGGQPQAAMGRYVEAPLDIPGGDWGAFAQGNGTICAVNRNGDTLLQALDLRENDWDSTDTGHDEQISPAKGGVNGLNVGADGALYLSSGWAMVNEDWYPYVERIKDGKSECVQLDQRLDTGADRLALCVLPSGELLGLSGIEAYRFSPEGVTRQRYAVSGGESMAAYGPEMAVCSTKNSLISILNIESGQTLRILELPAPASYGLIAYDAEGALYYLCPQGMYRVNAGGTLFEQIADGRLMSVSKPSFEARALLFDRDNNPVIAYSMGSAVSLIAYRYDENVATEPGTLLSVFTLYDSETLRECANRFGQRYPDVMVDITVALPEGAAVTRDDAIRTLNTELLAGKGPDVLVLDGLPVQSYIDKGVLMDLSPTVQPLIDSGALLENVAGALIKDGVMPAVPARFLLPTLWGDVEGLRTLSDMAAWAQANPDSLPYYAIDVEPLIGTFYPSCAPAWFTEDGRLDEEPIEAFLTAIKGVRGDWTYDAFVRLTGNDIHARAQQDGLAIAPDWNPYQPALLRYTTQEFLGCCYLSEDKQKQLPFLLRGLDSTTWPNGALASTEKGAFAPLPGQAEGCFMPMLLLGAGKGAANSDMALQFIAYALGEDAQNIDLQEGFPANIRSLDAAQARGQALCGVSGGFGWRSTWLNADQQKQLRGMIEALKKPVVPDFTLLQMLVQESAPFFEGKLSAQQAARNVCAKANAYLSE